MADKPIPQPETETAVSPERVVAALKASVEGGKITVRMPKTDASGKLVRGENGGLVIEDRALRPDHIQSFRVAGQAVSAVLADGRRLTGTLK